MRIMKRVYWIAFLCIFVYGISGCTPNVPITPTVVKDSDGLTAYATITLTPTVTSTPVNAPTTTLAPTMTPTPRAYTVKNNDTMIVIAFKNGLTLDELTSANPDVDPYLLKAGMTLYIPAPSGAPGTQSAPVPTPMAVLIGTPTCMAAVTGGLYCFALATNEQEFNLENITAEFLLVNPGSGDALSQKALLPMNRLNSGMSIPFFAYIAPPIFADPVVSLNVQTALQASSTSPIVTMQDPTIQIASDGFSALVNGTAQLDPGASNGSQLWIAAIALDDSGQVVGIRRTRITQTVNPGEGVAFTITVYSTGGKIARVELFGEAEN
jgi:LysM repeat protein